MKRVVMIIAQNGFRDEELLLPKEILEKAGIEVDGSFRPQHSRLENLFVCGSVLAHTEIMKNHCGHGLAIATGLKAAKMCERLLS